uniref:Secretory carrier-associated membrane protein n=1 Tax=Acanthochromis polyacanthus TaxID=80966 RepID=A0A3Q1GW67_9TELE
MSGFDANPFADPVDVNPFQVSEFNTSIVSQVNNSATTIPISAASSQPAVLQTSVEQSAQVTKENNWPPLPKFSPPNDIKNVLCFVFFPLLRSDSSFSFFFFFFVFFFQVAVYIIQTVGIPRWGNSGWIASISMIRSNLAVAVVMMVVAGFFTVNAALAVVLLKIVHSKYRRTGASFSKAQQEFSQGVLTNRSFQNAASSAATSAAQGAFSRGQGN